MVFPSVASKTAWFIRNIREMSGTDHTVSVHVNERFLHAQYATAESHPLPCGRFLLFLGLAVVFVTRDRRRLVYLEEVFEYCVHEFRDVGRL